MIVGAAHHALAYFRTVYFTVGTGPTLLAHVLEAAGLKLAFALVEVVANLIGALFHISLLVGTTLLFATHWEHWHLEAHAVIFEWSSVVFGCILVFCVNLGVQPMANLMTSELFPAEVRALCKVGQVQCKKKFSFFLQS